MEANVSKKLKLKDLNEREQTIKLTHKTELSCKSVKRFILFKHSYKKYVSSIEYKLAQGGISTTVIYDSFLPLMAVKEAAGASFHCVFSNQ